MLKKMKFLDRLKEISIGPPIRADPANSTNSISEKDAYDYFRLTYSLKNVY